MNPSFEQSFKKRLHNIAKERNLTPTEVWNNVIAERFLVRLCRSPHSSHFVLKGGTLLSKHLRLGRETQDLDFAVQRLSNEVFILQKVLEEIASIDVQDGFMFKNPKVVPLDHFRMKYMGAQARLAVHFGRARLPLFIDLGFGDVVAVQNKNIILTANSNGPLYEASLALQCYPLEFVFAEKLETVIHRGPDNSRMKDFQDLLSMVCAQHTLDGAETEAAIKAVFSHRHTKLLLPVLFDASQLMKLQMYWEQYRHGLTTPKELPDQVEHVIEIINTWLARETCFKQATRAFHERA